MSFAPTALPPKAQSKKAYRICLAVILTFSLLGLHRAPLEAIIEGSQQFTKNANLWLAVKKQDATAVNFIIFEGADPKART